MRYLIGEMRIRFVSFLLRLPVIIGAIFTMTVAIGMTLYILVRGVPHLKPALFSNTYTSVNVSLYPALINTLSMTIIALLLAVPIGIFSAVYLTEYARRGSHLVKLIRLTSETLSGIPSIVYGLFGMLFFVMMLGWGLSMISGACTLALMILPLIMRTTEEALLAVPDTYREGSFGLGAGRLRTVFNVVLPSAIPGILSGIILGSGRIVGETAALIYTAGTVAQVPENIFGSARTLAVHMYVLSSEGIYVNQSYATAVILLLLTALINTFSALVAKKLTKGRTNG